MEIKLNTSPGPTQVLEALQEALIPGYYFSEQKLLLMCNSVTHGKKIFQAKKAESFINFSQSREV